MAATLPRIEHQFDDDLASLLSVPAATVRPMAAGTVHQAAFGLVTDVDPFQRIEADTAALADAAEGRLGEPVPSCPGWTVADLVWHLTEVHAWWGGVVAGRVQDPDELSAPVRPADDVELVPGLRAGVGRMVASFRSAEPHEPVWTWAEQKDVAFVVRHQVHEAAVHRWDAEHAVGVESTLHAAAATDGVEEFLQIVTPYRNSGAERMGGRLALVALDTGFGWHVEEDDEGSTRWRRARGLPEESDAVLRATASDLLLFLYGRRSAADLGVTGEVGVAERFARGNPTD
jgi:uncharacterized protein (TIGR03083 family)